MNQCDFLYKPQFLWIKHCHDVRYGAGQELQYCPLLEQSGISGVTHEVVDGIEELLQ